MTAVTDKHQEDETMTMSSSDSDDVQTDRATRREAHRAGAFRWNATMELVRAQAAQGHGLTPSMRVRLGHYTTDRDAAERAGVLEHARKRAEGAR